MLSHADIWQGIDRLAQRHGLSPSALAKRAGLDATTFNPSKRVTKDNKPRWPSTESIAKVLEATDSTLDEFVTLMAAGGRAEAVRQSRIACIALDSLGTAGAFDAAGFPEHHKVWDELDFPALEDAHAYAVQVIGDQLEPFYRDGDVLVVSPSASVRRHDRVLVMLRDGRCLAATLQRRTAQKLELQDLDLHGSERTLATGEIAWLARILWASQ